jgi:hypothetical protein
MAAEQDAGTEVTLVTGRVVRVQAPAEEVVGRVGVAWKAAEEGLIDLTRQDGTLITLAASYVICIEGAHATPGVIPFRGRSRRTRVRRARHRRRRGRPGRRTGVRP